MSVCMHAHGRWCKMKWWFYPFICLDGNYTISVLGNEQNVLLISFKLLFNREKIGKCERFHLKEKLCGNETKLYFLLLPGIGGKVRYWSKRTHITFKLKLEKIYKELSWVSEQAQSTVCYVHDLAISSTHSCKKIEKKTLKKKKVSREKKFFQLFWVG